MSPELVPVYLLVDLAGEGADPAKQSSVDGFVRGFVGTLRAEPDLAPRVRLTVVGSGRTVLRLLNQAQLEHIGDVPMKVEGPRSYAIAFERVNRWLLEDRAELESRGTACRPPLLLVLTDAAPVPGDDWEAAFHGLVKANQNAVVRPVYHFNGHCWGSALRWPQDEEHGRAPEQLLDPVIAATEIVRAHAAPARPAPRRPSPTRPSSTPVPAQEPTPVPAQEPTPVPAREPAWAGGFTPYSVGEPGAAALRVKPRPDPTEWDRRDTVLDGVYLHDELDRRVLQLRAASVRGLSHRYNGTVRQDDYAFRCTEDRRHLVVVVSDGVSNSRLSHKAAGVVARLGAELVSLELARKPPARIEWAEIVTQLSDEIVRLGHKLVEPAPDGGELSVGEVAHHLAATALFGVIELRPVEPEVDAYFYAVGDSSAWVLREGGVWQAMFEVKNGGEGAATSATKALPLSRPPTAEAITTKVKKGDVVVLMSDGIGDPLEDGSRTVGRFLAEAWREPPAPLQFAAQVDFARKTHDDDRTAVAVWAV